MRRDVMRMATDTDEDLKFRIFQMIQPTNYPTVNPSISTAFNDVCLYNISNYSHSHYPIIIITLQIPSDNEIEIFPEIFPKFVASHIIYKFNIFYDSKI